jgi:hypothetical protein
MVTRDLVTQRRWLKHGTFVPLLQAGAYLNSFLGKSASGTPVEAKVKEGFAYPSAELSKKIGCDAFNVKVNSRRDCVCYESRTPIARPLTVAAIAEDE